MSLPFIRDILSAHSGLEDAFRELSIQISNKARPKSCFDVGGLAAASIASAGIILSRYAGQMPDVGINIDQRLSALWFTMTVHPDGWELPPIWDEFAGDYQARDGWIRLHTNAPHHRVAALSVLGPHQSRDALEKTIADCAIDELEAAVVDAGGCAAAMRGLQDWKHHPQGRAVMDEPLIHWQDTGTGEARLPDPTPGRPLQGVRVLDLTRVLAGPVAGRFLAAFGANVLRVDPPDWHEPAVVPEVTLGKRCTGLDLRKKADRDTFKDLLSSAHVLLHGLRPDALEGLGFGEATRRQINPSLVDVSLCAYGWSGPWSARRGFDSLVQMSCGIAAHGQQVTGSEKPVPLPFQALDHATGYLMASATLHALNEARRSGRILTARLSLARTAALLSTSAGPMEGTPLAVDPNKDLDPAIEQTDWGPARRIGFPLTVPGIAPRWDYPAGRLRSAPAAW